MGISPRTSTGITQLAQPPFATLPGAFQYPDPYAQRRANTASPYTSGADNQAIRFADLTEATLFGWHGYNTGTHLPAVGLGAALFTARGNLDPAFGDNIASDNPQ